MPEDIYSLIKLNNKIFRRTQSYLDKTLKEYNLSSGSYLYLLILHHNEGISQNKISEELGYDKAMSTRTIVKLIDAGYLNRERDAADSRANKLYLTDKGKTVIPHIIHVIHELIHQVTPDLNEEEKVIMISSLDKVLNNIKKL